MRFNKFGWALVLGLLVIVGLSTTRSLRAQTSAADQPLGALADPQARPSTLHQPDLRPTAPLSGTWSAEFAQGLEILGQVNDIITATNGDLYIAGDFDQVAGVDAQNIARWDGAQWSAVAPSTPPGLLTHIAIYHDEIYVVTGAEYETTRAGLWRYNAASQQWTKIATPSFVDSETGLGNFRNLVVFNDLLIASGYFELVNVQAMPGIVAWNGTAVQAIAPRTPNFYAGDVVITPTGLVVAGSYRDINEDNHSYLGRWDGTNWHELTSPLATVTELAWEANKLYIFNGSTEIQALTNNQWSHVSTISGSNPTFIGVMGGRPYTRACDATCGTMTLRRWQGNTSVTQGTYRTYGQSYNRGMTKIINEWVYVGGANTLPDGSKHALMRYRDGALSGVFGRIVSITPPLDLAIDQGKLYVATDADFTGPVTASNGMTWQDGAWTRWWPTDPKATENVVKHIRVLTHTDLLIGGRNLTISPTQTTALARSAQGVLTNLDPQRHCASVATTVYSASNLLAACRPPSGPSLEIAAFDGAQWSRLVDMRMDDPENENWINDMTQIAYHQRLYGLVREGSIYPLPVDNAFVYAWSGSGWYRLKIANQTLGALVQAPDGVYVANSKLYRSVANGFEEVAATNGNIRTILVEGERIWIGGDFSQVNGVAANNVALWDGQAWHALGEGTNGRVTRLAYDSGALAIGGFFTRAGGVRANGISVWKDQAVVEPSITLFLPLISQ
jgi:trimeric autotransporter adhesin